MSARRPPLAAPELRWLFCEAEGELGMRSSHGILVDLAMSGVTSGAGAGRSVTPSQHRIDAARESRKLRAIVAALSTRHQEVLWLAYGPQPWPREVRRPAYGPWPGVLLLCAGAQRAFARAGVRAAKATTSAPEPELLPSMLGRVHGPGAEERRLLGPLRDASLDAVSAFVRRGLGEWLRLPSTLADRALLSRLRDEARALVAEAHAAYRARAPVGVLEALAVGTPRSRRRDVVAVEELQL